MEHIFNETTTVFKCGYCLYYDSVAGKIPEDFVSKCKRIDHNILQFATSVIGVYQSGYYFHMICSDFEPKPSCKAICEDWEKVKADFDKYVEFEKHERNILRCSLKIKNVDGCIYHMKMDDFIYGKVIRPDGKLNVYEKCYLKRVKDIFSYRLITEKIDGIDIPKKPIKGEEEGVNEKWNHT